MTFAQQIRDIAQAAAQQLSAQTEERLMGLATEVSQAAAADRVTVVRELRLAADAEVAKRSQEAVAAAQAEHARRLEDAVAAVRLEGTRRLEETVATIREEQTTRVSDAIAATRAELQREREAAVGAVRVELDRQREAELAALRADLAPQIDAALAAARAEHARTLADSLARARADADEREAKAVDETRREEGERVRRTLAETHVADQPVQAAQVERLNEGIQRLDAAKSLTDALDTLAEMAGREAPRVAVFVLRGSRLTGWRYSGFPSDVDPSRMEIAADAPGLLAQALRVGKAVATSSGQPGDPALATPFGTMTVPNVGLAVPVRIGGETVAVVYADNAAADRAASAGFAEAIDVLARHAARCLEVLTFARAAVQAAPRRFAAMPPPTHPAAQMPVTLAPPFSPANLTAAGFAAPGPQPPLSTTVPDVAPSPRYAPQTRAFQPTGDEEDDSARRYARLLVSEIKLYHEAAVTEGRRSRNLLERLRPEIERAQHLYEERVPVQVRLRSDFFGQELVRTLASGDPTLLGAR